MNFGYRCEFCGQFLYDDYVQIIFKLKEANIIPEEYEMLCCECFHAKKELFL